MVVFIKNYVKGDFMYKEYLLFPQTWDEFVEATILHCVAILGAKYTKAMRKKVKKDRCFCYNGFSYYENGTINFCTPFTGIEKDFKKDLSIEQMFLFFYMENISK